MAVYAVRRHIATFRGVALSSAGWDVSVAEVTARGPVLDALKPPVMGCLGALVTFRRCCESSRL